MPTDIKFSRARNKVDNRSVPLGVRATEIVGVNATSVYLDLPDGVEVDNELGELSAGIVGRQTLLDGIESIL